MYFLKEVFPHRKMASIPLAIPVFVHLGILSSVIMRVCRTSDIYFGVGQVSLQPCIDGVIRKPPKNVR